MLSDSQAIAALRELQVIAPALSADAVATRAAAILDRSTLKPLDLAAFLEARGHRGPQLVHVMGAFSLEVAHEYERTYGAAPVKRHMLVGAEWRRVNAYLEVDRPVLERAYASVVKAAA